MNVYIVTSEFSAPQLGVRLLVGDTVGKIGARVACLVGATEYDSEAFYDWVATDNSLLYLAFVGVFPDPPVPGVPNVKSGVVPITSGASVVTLAGAGWGFIPSGIAAVVLKPAGGDNLFATVRTATITANGFTADLSSNAPAAGYSLGYVVVE